MTINWGAGKTEAMINFRGKRQTIETPSVLNPDGSRSLTVKVDCVAASADTTNQVTMNIVDGYKHLGSRIDASRSLLPKLVAASRLPCRTRRLPRGCSETNLLAYARKLGWVFVLSSVS